MSLLHVAGVGWVLGGVVPGSIAGGELRMVGRRGEEEGLDVTGEGQDIYPSSPGWGGDVGGRGVAAAGAWVSCGCGWLVLGVRVGLS